MLLLEIDCWNGYVTKRIIVKQHQLFLIFFSHTHDTFSNIFEEPLGKSVD